MAPTCRKWSCAAGFFAFEAGMTIFNFVDRTTMTTVTNGLTWTVLAIGVRRGLAEFTGR